jgi:hypothetical protein
MKIGELPYNDNRKENLENLDLDSWHKTIVIYPNNNKAKIVTLEGTVDIPEKHILAKCSICGGQTPVPQSIISDKPENQYVFRDTKANLSKTEDDTPAKVCWKPSKEGFGLPVYCSSKCKVLSQL